eukprot:7294505-Prymnesium_polylepis.1
MSSALVAGPNSGCSTSSAAAAKGSCIYGLCVCSGGAFGIDCAHPTPTIGPDARVDSRTQRDLAIYVYEVPPELTLVPMASKAGEDVMYTAERMFVHTLLSDRTVRTLDPEAADLFLVPLFS